MDKTIPTISTDEWLVIDRIDGWLTIDEANLLYRLAKAMPEGTDWCEIGSWKGRSTVTLAMSGRNGYAIDWFLGTTQSPPETDTLSEYRRNIKDYQDRIITVVGKSEKIHYMVPRNLGLLFIDAEHNTENITKDFLNYENKLVPEGVLIFHDYAEDETRDHYPDVTKFVNGLLESGKWKQVDRAGRCIALCRSGHSS